MFSLQLKRALYQLDTGVYDVPMPSEVTKLLSIFELLNLNIAGIGVPLQCYGIGTFEQQLAVTMLVPVVIAILIMLGFALHAYRRHRRVATGLMMALPYLLSLSFLVFPMVSSLRYAVHPPLAQARAHCTA